MTDNEQLARPWQVSTAVKLIYATLAIGTFMLVMDPTFFEMIVEDIMVETSSVGIVFFDFGLVITLMLFTLFTLCFYIHMLGKGENWVRIIFLVLIMPTVPSSILNTILSLNHAPLPLIDHGEGPDILGLAEMAMLMTAAVLLLHDSSSFWFKVMKQSKSKT